MGDVTERRSAMDAPAQLDWVGGLPVAGVGGRQQGQRASRRGGGYLHECNGLEVREAARVRELADMGLPAVWLNVVHEIGYENFLALWRVLDAATELRSESESMIEVKLRRFASFRRYQRNRYIEALAAVGLDDSQIRERIRVELGEELTRSHIWRLHTRRRVAPR